MNNVANMPHILMYFLQIQNIKRESYKKKDIQDLNKKGKENLDIEIKPEPKEEEEIEKNKEDK
jgi:di/tripeptidase